jgi:hypothetical protein
MRSAIISLSGTAILVLAAVANAAEPTITLSNCELVGGSPDAGLDCEVTNLLDTAIAMMGAEVSYVEMDRAVPWARLRYDLDVPGGIEPGETRSISFKVPEVDHSLPIGEDAVFKVEILGALDVENDHIFYGSGIAVATAAPISRSEAEAGEVDPERQALIIIDADRGVGDLVVEAD